jgi:hypothetical protein
MRMVGGDLWNVLELQALPYSPDFRQNRRMNKLQNDDYLLEITVRLAVRKQDAAEVIALGAQRKQDATELDKVGSAIVDLLDRGLVKHDKLIEVAQYTASRLSSVAKFHDFVDETFRQFQRREGKLQLVPKPTKKRGKKSSS